MYYKINCKPFDDGTESEPHVVKDVHHFQISGGETPFVHLLGKDGKQLGSFNLAYVDTVHPLFEAEVAV